METEVFTASRRRGRPMNDAPLREENTNNDSFRGDVFNEHLRDKRQQGDALDAGRDGCNTRFRDNKKKTKKISKKRSSHTPCSRCSLKYNRVCSDALTLTERPRIADCHINRKLRPMRTTSRGPLF